MAEGEKDRLIKILKTKYPNQNEAVLFEMASQLLNFGYFVVRLWLKSRAGHQKTTFTAQIEQETQNPPPINKPP